MPGLGAYTTVFSCLGYGGLSVAFRGPIKMAQAQLSWKGSACSVRMGQPFILVPTSPPAHQGWGCLSVIHCRSFCPYSAQILTDGRWGSPLPRHLIGNDSFLISAIDFWRYNHLDWERWIQFLTFLSITNFSQAKPWICHLLFIHLGACRRKFCHHPLKGSYRVVRWVFRVWMHFICCFQLWSNNFFLGEKEKSFQHPATFDMMALRKLTSFATFLYILKIKLFFVQILNKE